jgi:hypothetical protein
LLLICTGLLVLLLLLRIIELRLTPRRSIASLVAWKMQWGNN